MTGLTSAGSPASATIRTRTPWVAGSRPTSTPIRARPLSTAFWAVPAAPIPPSHFFDDVKRLAKTPAIYPIVLLLFLWNFTPGAGTPIQFYLTKELHGNAEDFGRFNAIFGGFFIPGFLLYGFLCTRVNYRLLLWICTFIAVPQILPLLMVHDKHTAMIAALNLNRMVGSPH